PKLQLDLNRYSFKIIQLTVAATHPTPPNLEMLHLDFDSNQISQLRCEMTKQKTHPIVCRSASY
ncbi:hypothetical protein, partial [Terriglobus albidus]|uniref:hypothetical protein n=1 Tax=Terriglobus albidus TaxID=1592106 RepID=UPI0021DF5B3A